MALSIVKANYFIVLLNKALTEGLVLVRYKK